LNFIGLTPYLRKNKPIMRYILPAFVLCSVIGLGSANAQSKDTTKPKMANHDSDAKFTAPVVTDSTAVLQGRDLQELVNLIQDYPAKYANPITQWLQQRYQLRLGELLKKEKH
jgi:hypothetical protein